MALRTLILLPPWEKVPGGRGPAWRPGTMSLDELDAAPGPDLAGSIGGRRGT
jgi:hypothetical protein